MPPILIDPRARRRRRRVPSGDHRPAVLGAKRADRSGIEPEQGSGGGRQAELAGGEDAQKMAVSDEDDVAQGGVGQDRTDARKDPVGPCANLLRALTRVVCGTGSHTVGPERPAGSRAADLRSGEAFVTAIVPLVQIGFDLGVPEGG